jgi:hypothetical protein
MPEAGGVRERWKEFDARQEAFVARLSGAGIAGLTSGTIVVVPSITFPSSELRKILGIQRYEERMMFTLLWLADRSVRVVYVTSLPVDEAIVDYYLSFLDDPEEGRSRLAMISARDAEIEPLTTKLLARPEIVAEIRDAAGEKGDAYILPFNVTSLERELADSLRLPLYGPHPDLVRWGSKSGSRAAARRAGVPVLEGEEDLFSLEEVERAISGIAARSERADAVVIKLNNGFSGQGNAILELSGLNFPLDQTPTVFCAEGESWLSYAEKLIGEGAIVEELVRAPGVQSPSVQMRIAPGGECEVLSTHDQILGGPDKQVYLGCRFPARAEYRAGIQDYALRVAGVLADEGIMGLLGIDFVVLSDEETYMSEINLRVGGTTHPYFMAQLATKGAYDVGTGELVAGGEPRSYVGSDNLKRAAYRNLTPAAAIQAIEGAGLAFDRQTLTGVTLHLLGTLPEHGKMGMVCIAESLDEADALHHDAVGALDAASAVD